MSVRDNNRLMAYFVRGIAMVFPKAFCFFVLAFITILTGLNKCIEYGLKKKTEFL